VVSTPRQCGLVGNVEILDFCHVGAHLPGPFLTSTNQINFCLIFLRRRKKTQLDHTENSGAISQKGMKLETEQISEKYHVS
jgi:hypothetical protein